MPLEERRITISFTLIFILILFAGTSLLFLENEELRGALSLFVKPLAKKKEETALSFSLGLQKAPVQVSYTSLQGKIRLFSASPRPGLSTKKRKIFLQIKGIESVKEISLVKPLYIGLDVSGQLCFSQERTPFWIEWKKGAKEEVTAKVIAEPQPLSPSCIEEFKVAVEPTPAKSLTNIAQGHPFRHLAELVWWGSDILRSSFKGENLYRLEAPDSRTFIDLLQKEWLIFQEGVWQKGENLSLPAIAHIEKIEGDTLYFEGWQGEEYLRVALPLSPTPPFKPNFDELFGSIRIRSEKQISCTLEKQCLILKEGDWAFKKEEGWRVLRKKEDQEALLASLALGEVFIFEKIETRQGQKFVEGSFYNRTHSQKASLQLPGGFARKSKGQAIPKRKGMEP